MIRAGIQNLLANAQMGRFDIVRSEALDRISRNQEDVAAVFKRLRFAGNLANTREGRARRLHLTNRPVTLLAFLPSCLLAFLPSCLLAFLPACSPAAAVAAGSAW